MIPVKISYGLFFTKRKKIEENKWRKERIIRLNMASPRSRDFLIALAAFATNGESDPESAVITARISGLSGLLL